MNVRVEDLGAALRTYETRADEALRAVVVWAANTVVVVARATHPYTDRTGNLTGSFEALPAVGSAMGGTLLGGALAGMAYASYLEASTQWAFFGPAWQQVQPFFEVAADQALGHTWNTL